MDKNKVDFMIKQARKSNMTETYSMLFMAHLTGQEVPQILNTKKNGVALSQRIDLPIDVINGEYQCSIKTPLRLLQPHIDNEQSNA